MFRRIECTNTKEKVLNVIWLFQSYFSCSIFLFKVFFPIFYKYLFCFRVSDPLLFLVLDPGLTTGSGSKIVIKCVDFCSPRNLENFPGITELGPPGNSEPNPGVGAKAFSFKAPFKRLWAPCDAFGTPSVAESVTPSFGIGYIRPCVQKSLKITYSWTYLHW